MEVTNVLADLERAGAVLTVEAERLRVQAPAGVVTPERREAIKRQRDALIALVVVANEAHALDRLDHVLGDDGAEPEPIVAQRSDNVPPLECIGRRVCSVVGVCDRDVAGNPCRVAA